MPYTDLPPRRSSLARRSANSPETRRSSRVHFDDEEDEQPSVTDDIVGGYEGSSNGDAASTIPTPPPAHPAQEDVDWNIPDYQHPGTPRLTADSARRSPNNVSPRGSRSDGHRDSNATLYEGGSRDSFDVQGDPGKEDPKRSFSSYNHPYDIRPPREAHTDSPSRPSRASVASGPSAYSQDERTDNGESNSGDEDDGAACNLGTRDDRHRGYLSNLMDLYANDKKAGKEQSGPDRSRLYRRVARGNSFESTMTTSTRPEMNRFDSYMSNDSQVVDPDDPTVTGERKNNLDDPEDLEKACMKTMNYKARRKLRQRIRIEFNITSVLNRQKFLMRLAKALMTFGAPSHRIESQLLSAARILEVDAEFIHIPGVIICSFGDQETKTSEMHFVKCGGRLSLGSLHEVHQIYRQVVHDEISARKATVKLEALMAAKPLYGAIVRCSLAFCLSGLICVLAFGGSFVDMWIAGIGATFLCLMQIGVATKSQLYANVFEISVTIIISFAARGLSSIRSQIFCYTAISSAGIVGILPGYLILSSSLELASKNIVCGSVKMVYALIYTLFLGFGLQIGSDLYLLFDQGARQNLAALAARMMTAATITGTFVSDNGTFANINHGAPLEGTFTFVSGAPFVQEHIIDGCYRPPTFPWYLQPFPWWTQFIIVPTFSIMSSLANLQPLWTVELVVMVVISCVSYAANKVANHFIFNRSDVVSAIGAFAVGLLGNIYSRKMGGTAFTSMVTGVLFLVPSGLSQAGGITAQGNGIDIGGAMIAVTIGITVGLFMSQALVYMFGSRKNAAIFSF
ncbi:hypothetical protein VTO73DRAFT_14842 [Trametes versicolor]